MSTVFAERPRFFEGQFLGADDLESFLTYAREHVARHQLGAHTWGVIAGLELVAGTSATGDPEYFLAPGVAVDGYGRLLVLSTPFKLTTDLFAAQPSGSVDVWVRHEDTPYDGSRPGFQTCDCSDEFSRVAESLVVEVGPRGSIAARQSGIVVGEDGFTDAREALGHHLPGQPIACDGSVAAQIFPAEDDPDLWLIPVGQVPWNKLAGAFTAASEADLKASRIARRHAGIVAEHLYPSAGVLRLRPRFSARQAGLTTDQICATDTIQEGDLVSCGGELTFREMIWLESHVRFRRDARLYGGTLEFQDGAGTDYLADGVPLAMRRRPERNEHHGFDLQVLLGQRKNADGPTRLTVCKATVSGADPCSMTYTVTEPGVYVQEDAKVGIGTTGTLLSLPLTIRAVGDNGDLLGLEAADGTLAWQLNLGPNGNGLNITGPDPTTSFLFVESSGDIGIGTLDPQAKLDIRSLPAPGVGNALGAGKWLQVGDGDDKGRVWLQYGDQAAPLLVMSDLDDPARVQFQQIGSGTETGPQFSSWIGHARNNSADLAVMGAPLGIGTLVPFTTLTVLGSLGFKAGGEPMIYIHETGTANSERMVLAHSPAFRDWGLSYRDSTDAFVFLGDGNVAMAVDLAGRRVGIGTATPADALEVRGNVRLGGAGDHFAVGCPDNLRMVAGRVAANGTLQSGAGYSVSRTSTGQYQVSFSNAFTQTPVVVATAVDATNDDNFLTIVGANGSGFQLRMKDDDHSADADFQDSAFNFIAMGPRA